MKNSTNKKSPLSDYAKYSGLAFQMMATIALGVWGGTKLDQWTGWKFPVFTVILPMIGIVGSIILLIRSLPKQ
ncbi:AtpZ/AtpI family protein [Cytophagaceae bacterium DM2B3-1]|uniref:AtpZ/AtpI family protein n=2 Tax=Xanthocytophaga TaxID=3078918 RepID=A0AAE3QUL5_9BACT|nr:MULTISPECIES: AtpZ/AtpI family protein [Xanthocytophaga]MDJ1468270.1 AtpZ/AtpI family protein [Xanthocytophaga flavus]MDJ1485286.1 AtpZ/AtpI family protein [Xanthocytophaga flavus]MDJ1494637.1 AtpZ/AtpI family protein [Xanthocytophaga flavus]MDJ1505095.1 AtpZ/AtpI family protein [Xanthocytophaga agilis]